MKNRQFLHTYDDLEAFSPQFIIDRLLFKIKKEKDLN